MLRLSRNSGEAMSKRTQLRRVFNALLIAGAILAVPTGSAVAKASSTESAVFAGGCFWCMEPPFDKLDGVVSTTSGYIGGHVEEPTYKQVVGGRTGHAEAVQVVYDPARVSYQELLDVFWRNVDPVDARGQFCDKGDQYRSAVFYEGDDQKRAAEESKVSLEASGRFQEPIVTEIVPATTFYPAEDYHQDYYLKNPLRYKYYRFGCGRDRRLKKLWEDATS